MVVLIILVAVMSVAYPRITGQLQQVTAKEAALQLKTDLAEMREQAVSSAEPWVIRIRRGTSEYEFGPMNAFEKREDALPTSTTLGGDFSMTPSPNAEQILNELDSNAVTTTDSASNSASLSRPAVPQSAIEQHTLPTGMVFDDGWAHSTQEANQFRAPNAGVVATQPLATPASLALPPRNQWKYVVIFQADGRATESEFRLKDESSQATIRLRVRSLTGGVTIGELERYQPEIQDPFDPSDPTSTDGIDALLEPSRSPDAERSSGVGREGLLPQQGVRYRIDSAVVGVLALAACSEEGCHRRLKPALQLEPNQRLRRCLERQCRETHDNKLVARCTTSGGML